MTQENGSLPRNLSPENIAQLAKMREKLAQQIAQKRIDGAMGVPGGAGPRTVEDRLRAAEEKAQRLREQAAEMARKKAAKAARDAERAALGRSSRVHYGELVSRVLKLEKQMIQLYSELGIKP